MLSQNIAENSPHIKQQNMNKHLYQSFMSALPLACSFFCFYISTNLKMSLVFNEKYNYFCLNHTNCHQT